MLATRSARSILMAMMMLSACATSTTWKTSDISDKSLPLSALLFQYEIKSDLEPIPTPSCELTFRDVATGLSFSVTATNELHPLLIEATPGRYELKEIRCDAHNHWRVTHMGFQYQVENGKINYGGTLTLKVNHLHDLEVRVSRPDRAALKKLAKKFVMESDSARLVPAF